MHNCGFVTGLLTGRRAMNAAILSAGAFALVLGATIQVQPIRAAEKATATAQDSKVEEPPQIEPVSLQQSASALLGLAKSQVFKAQVSDVPTQPIQIAVPVGEQVLTLQLTPHSIRSDIYEVLAQIEDGSYVPVEPGPVRTLRGGFAEVPGSRAAGSLNEDGLYVDIILPDGGEIGIEPLFGRVDGAAKDDYAIYNASDVIDTGGICGTDAPPRDVDPIVNEGGIAGATLFCAQIACDADFEFYIEHGSSITNVENTINNIINALNLQYEAEVDIRHVITTIIVRTAEPDPYTSTSASTLLCEFRTHWNANQNAVVRDIAHLFTGKSLAGSTIGVAFLGVICNVSANVCSGFGNAAYSLVETDAVAAFTCKTDLSAHELGHTWDATHCSGTCNSTMNASIQCANTFTNSSPDSVAQIVAFRNTRNCLEICEDGTTTLPFFDDFPNSTIDQAKWTGIDGAESNTLGLNEPSATFSANLDGSGNGGDQIRTAMIDTSNLALLQLSYFYQRTGGGDSTESGEDLVVEYVANTGGWVELHRQLGSGADMTTFAQVNVDIPVNALHDNFRLRFRSISSNVGSDDWFVDNVNLVGFVNPPNNNCSSATVALSGLHPFSLFGASTDGPNDTTACNFNGFTQITNDIWYLYPAECTGTATFSLCGANFNSKLAVYGPSCPGGTPNLALGCNDSFCGDDAQVTIPVTSGQIFRIRVGSVNNVFGTGTLVISCTPTAPPPCPADITDNNIVDVDDLLAVINAWGPCINPNNCPSDIAPANGNDVVDVDDLLSVINAWGACPN